MRIKQSVCYPMLKPPDVSLSDLFKAAAQIGYAAVELWDREDNFEWIGHFHTAGNPGRRDMDDTQELNYAGICRAIAATGYDLYVAHEFQPKGDVIEALRAAFALCDQG